MTNGKSIQINVGHSPAPFGDEPSDNGFAEPVS